MIDIISVDDPVLNVYSRLTEAQLRNRLEPEKGIFICESPKVINTALDSGIEPLSLLAETDHIDSASKDVIERVESMGVPVYRASNSILKAYSGYALTRGVLCAMRRPKTVSPEEICSKNGLIAILENVVDSTNTGAIFRSAVALGADAVLLFPDCSDPLNRRSVRVSMGTVFQISWGYLPKADTAEQALSVLKTNGYKLFAMALDDNSLTLDDAVKRQTDRTALVFGAEGDGLKADTIAACDYTVKIPMYHGVDSLNVAAAAALGIYTFRNSNK